MSKTKFKAVGLEFEGHSPFPLQLRKRGEKLASFYLIFIFEVKSSCPWACQNDVFNFNVHAQMLTAQKVLELAPLKPQSRESSRFTWAWWFVARRFPDPLCGSILARSTWAELYATSCLEEAAARCAICCVFPRSKEEWNWWNVFKKVENCSQDLCSHHSNCVYLGKNLYCTAVSHWHESIPLCSCFSFRFRFHRL